MSARDFNTLDMTEIFMNIREMTYTTINRNYRQTFKQKVFSFSSELCLSFSPISFSPKKEDCRHSKGNMPLENF